MPTMSKSRSRMTSFQASSFSAPLPPSCFEGGNVSLEGTSSERVDTAANASKPPFNYYSHDEVMCLLATVRKHRDVIFASLRGSSDMLSIMRAEKKHAWNEVTKAVNSFDPDRPQKWTETQVREKWKGLLKIAKRDFQTVKDAASRMQGSPDIGRYSEFVWDIYGNDIETLGQTRSRSKSNTGAVISKKPTKRRRKETTGNNQSGSVIHSSSSSSFQNGEDDDSAYYGTTGEDADEFQDSEYVNQNYDEESYKRYVQDEEGCVPIIVSADDDSEVENDSHARELPPSVAKRRSPRNQPLPWNVEIEEADEDDGVEEELDEDAITDDELSAHATNSSRNNAIVGSTRNNLNAHDIQDDDDEDLESMQRRLVKAKMAKIALQKAKIESQLEKLNMEKEIIALEKQKVELEMFLIRQKMNNVCSVVD